MPGKRIKTIRRAIKKYMKECGKARANPTRTQKRKCDHAKRAYKAMRAKHPT